MSGMIRFSFRRLIRSLAWCSGFVAAGLAVSHATTSGGEMTPVLFNDDGDFTFVGETKEAWRENLSRMLAPLPAVPATGLVYSLGTGTDVLLYPSQAGSPWGWRGNEVPARLKHIRNFPRAVQSGIDGVRWAAEDAKALGLGFVPAFRLNDAHYTAGTSPYLEGEFWAKNRERLTFGTPPFRVGKLSGYRELLDFSHAEVREHRLAVIREAITRYAGVMDGFLLDFMRHPVFFTPETAEEKAPLMTEFVAEVRKALDAAGPADGRRLPLLVRVPPTVHNARKSGLDVAAWMRRGLVQIVLPSQSMTLAQDTDLAEFKHAAAGTDVKIFASIYQRSAYTFAFGQRAPVAADYAGRAATSALLRGAAINYRAMGAEGFELYNFNLPIRPEQAAGLAAFAHSREDFRAAERTYAITPAYFVDYLDAFEPPKQLPHKLHPGHRGQTFRLFVGEPREWHDRLVYTGLRIGLITTSEAPPLAIWLNGIRLDGDDDGSTVSRPGVSAAPQFYRQWPLGRILNSLRTGWNEVRVALNVEGDAPVTVMEIQLGMLPVSPENQGGGEAPRGDQQ